MSFPERQGFNPKIVVIVASILTTAHFLYHAFYNQHYFFSTDAFYYLSIARNLVSGLGFYDGTSLPKGPIVTPQNGVVFIEFLIMKAGITDNHVVFLLMAFINLLFFFYSAFLLYRLGEFFEIQKSLIALIVCVFLFSANLFIAMVAPINDGINMALSLLGTVIIIKNSNEWKWINCVYLLAISLIAVHFRSQYLLIPLSAALASLAVKRFKGFAAYSIIVFASSLTVFIIYGLLIENNGGIRSTAAAYTNYSVDTLKSIPYELGLAYSVLLMKLGQGAGIWLTRLSVPFFIALSVLIIIYCIVTALRKEFKSLFISLIILGTIGMFTTTLNHSFRYIAITAPLLAILLCASPKRVPFMRYMLASYLVYSIFITFIKIARVDYNYSEQKQATINVLSHFDRRALLISEEPRSSYFILNIPSVRELSTLNEAGTFYIFGSRDFIKKEKERLRQTVEIEDYGDHWYIDTSRYAIVKVERLPAASAPPISSKQTGVENSIP